MNISMPALLLAPALAAAHPPQWLLATWFTIAALSLVASAVFSGNEIGLYSLSKVRLRLHTARREKNALILEDWLRQPTNPLEGLLILQNISGFAFSASVTEILAAYGFSEFSQGLISILLVIPLVLIFADIMPKDLYHSHADQWTYRQVPLLRFFFGLLTIIGVLPLVHLLGRISVRLVGSKSIADNQPKGPRTEMLALFQESAATGLLTGTQQDLVQRALRLARINIREIMIPWNRVVGVPASISADGFRALVRRYNVSRLPVLGRSTSEVLGFVEVQDVLIALASPAAGPLRLTDHLHPAMTLIGEQTVRSAITLMQKARQTLAVVVDRQGRALGLVTMKDLVEELVGDLESW